MLCRLRTTKDIDLGYLPGGSGGESQQKVTLKEVKRSAVREARESAQTSRRKPTDRLQGYNSFGELTGAT